MCVLFLNFINERVFIVFVYVFTFFHYVFIVFTFFIFYINVLLNFEWYDRRFETKQKSVRHIMIPHTYCPVVVISC